jgi:hypothetical protein
MVRSSARVASGRYRTVTLENLRDGQFLPTSGRSIFRTALSSR